MSVESKNDSGLAEFVSEIDGILNRDPDEQNLTKEVATQLEKLLAGPFTLPLEFTRPRKDRYVMYPLYVDPEKRFSVAAAVWNVGQATPVHGHDTWGVVGIYSGIEGETRYNKPLVEDVPLTVAEDGLKWRSGEVTICCTTDDDVHQVACIGDEPCIGIHVYGDDIGTLSRRSYDPVTGEVKWFTSHWETSPTSS